MKPLSSARSAPAHRHARFVSACALVIALTACGGSDPPAAPSGLSREALGSAPAGSAAGSNKKALAATATVGADRLFDWAEATYPQHFPGHQVNQTSNPYVYRHYPNTGNYVGVAGQDVYILGPVSGGELLRVGSLAELACQVGPSACTAPNVIAATLDKAEFVMVEAAFSGPSDPRRPFVQQALDTIRRYPEAVRGNAVDWSLVPAQAKSAWATQVQDGRNGFQDSPEVTHIREVIGVAQLKASNEIDAESRKAVRQMSRVLAKNAANMLATSIDSAVKIAPAYKAAQAVRGVTSFAKLKSNAALILTFQPKVGALTRAVAGCTQVFDDLAFFDTLQDQSDFSKGLDVSLSIGKCLAAMVDSDRFGLVVESIAGGKALYDGTTDGDFLKFAESLANMFAASLDVAGLPVAAAIVNETTLYFITQWTALNDLNKLGDRVQGELDDAIAGVRAKFDALLINAASATLSARLAPYLRPRHLINLTLPNTVTVGQDVVADIDQKTGQPIAYSFDWGRYPDGTAVSAAPSRWSSSGGTTSLPTIRYRGPGVYNVIIELADNTFGVPFGPFQILTHRLEVTCPPGQAPDPDGTCRWVPVTLPLRLDESSPTGWRTAITIESTASPGTVGRIDFQALSCGGTVSYRGRSAAGGFLLAETLTYGNCVPGCTIEVASDLLRMRESCPGLVDDEWRALKAPAFSAAQFESALNQLSGGR